MEGCSGRGRIEVELESPAPLSLSAAGVGEKGAWAGGQELMLRSAPV